MFNLKWSNSLFTITTMSGTLIALSATNWVTMFIGMELNLFAFIPLIVKTPNNKEYEAATKYFLAQSLGSLLLMTSMMLSSSYGILQSPAFLVVPALMLKAGAAPLHFWFPNVMAGLNWYMCLLLTTWQKILPLLFLFNIVTHPLGYLLLILFSSGALIGAIGGINQSSLRGLLAYSSISHMSWMLCISLVSPLCAYLYLLIYIFTTSAIILLLAPLLTSDTPKPNPHTSLPMSHKIILSTLWLSLAGLPPLLGFLPKWQILHHLTAASPWALIPLLIGSLISLFFYLKISLVLLLSSTWNQYKPPKFSLFPYAIIIAVLNLPIWMLLMYY